MRKSVMTLLSAAILVAATATVVLAVDTTLRINFVDQEAGIITLGADQILVPEGFDISALRIGILVTATYDDTGEEPFQATEIVVH